MGRVIPTRFKEVDIGDPMTNSAVAQDKLMAATGKVVLIKDMHFGEDYQLGKVNCTENALGCYGFTRYLSRGREQGMRLHYHDLEGLLVGQ